MARARDAVAPQENERQQVEQEHARPDGESQHLDLLRSHAPRLGLLRKVDHVEGYARHEPADARRVSRSR